VPPLSEHTGMRRAFPVACNIAFLVRGAASSRHEALAASRARRYCTVGRRHAGASRPRPPFNAASRATISSWYCGPLECMTLPHTCGHGMIAAGRGRTQIRQRQPSLNRDRRPENGALSQCRCERSPEYSVLGLDSTERPCRRRQRATKAAQCTDGVHPGVAPRCRSCRGPPRAYSLSGGCL
jgi:hypothetical protein